MGGFNHKIRSWLKRQLHIPKVLIPIIEQYLVMQSPSHLPIPRTLPILHDGGYTNAPTDWIQLAGCDRCGQHDKRNTFITEDGRRLKEWVMFDCYNEASMAMELLYSFCGECSLKFGFNDARRYLGGYRRGIQPQNQFKPFVWPNSDPQSLRAIRWLKRFRRKHTWRAPVRCDYPVVYVGGRIIYKWATSHS